MKQGNIERKRVNDMKKLTNTEILDLTDSNDMALYGIEKAELLLTEIIDGYGQERDVTPQSIHTALNNFLMGKGSGQIAGWIFDYTSINLKLDIILDCLLSAKRVLGQSQEKADVPE